MSGIFTKCIIAITPTGTGYLIAYPKEYIDWGFHFGESIESSITNWQIIPKATGIYECELRFNTVDKLTDSDIGIFAQNIKKMYCETHKSLNYRAWLSSR